MRGVLAWLRTMFISGLLALMPVGLTVWVIWGLYLFIDSYVGKGSALGRAIENAIGRWIPGLGIIVTILIVFVMGIIIRNVVGRTLHYYFERIFFAVPGIGKLYRTFKRFSNALLNRSKTSSFQQVVMFEFPKKDVYVLGVLTNENVGKLGEHSGEECLIVYTPTAPNPLSGYMLIVPKRLVTFVDIPVEDALSMVVSSGSALPDSLRREDDPSEDDDEGRRIRFKRERRDS